MCLVTLLRALVASMCVPSCFINIGFVPGLQVMCVYKRIHVGGFHSTGSYFLHKDGIRSFNNRVEVKLSNCHDCYLKM